MAVWFFSAPPLFPANASAAALAPSQLNYGERVDLVGTFPHAVIAVCMFAVLGARLVFKTVLGINMPLPGFMRVKETDTDAMAGAPTLTEARAVHRLESYSLASQRRFGDGATLSSSSALEDRISCVTPARAQRSSKRRADSRCRPISSIRAHRRTWSWA
jgi:hypothetical protein